MMTDVYINCQVEREDLKNRYHGWYKQKMTDFWNIVGISMFCHNLLLFILSILNLENLKHLSINKSKISICKKIPLGT